MSQHILEISQAGYTLKQERGFIKVYAGKELKGQVVLDDVLCVLINVQGCLISTNLLDTLANANVPIAMCGQQYMPNAFVLPTSGKGRQYQVMQGQIGLTQPKRKRHWQAVVRAKLTNQAVLLEQLGVNAKPMHKLVAKTKSGDPDNCEAQGARFYWQKLFGTQFRRNRDAADINAALNYTYAVLRSCMARGIVAAGLHPTFSLHHKNPQNPINLVDDLMEPFRPVCDALVNIKVSDQFNGELDVPLKQHLARIASVPVFINNEHSPLSVACVKLARSFAHCLSENSSTMQLPTLTSQIEMAAV